MVDAEGLPTSIYSPPKSIPLHIAMSVGERGKCWRGGPNWPYDFLPTPHISGNYLGMICDPVLANKAAEV